MAAAAAAVPAIYTLWAALIGAGGLVVGAALSTFNDWGKDKRAAKREASADDRAMKLERNKRREDTTWRWLEKRESFERDTALQLQDEFFKFARAFTLAMSEDEKEFANTGEWERGRLSTDVDEEFRRATVALQTLRVRVFEGSLRDQIEEYIDVCVDALTQRAKSSSASEARDRSHVLERRSQELFRPLNEMLGQKLRSAVSALNLDQVIQLSDALWSTVPETDAE